MIIFLGISGAGKSTHSILTAKRMDCPRVSVGDLLRANMTGEEAEQLLSGKLVDDSKLLPLLEAELNRLAGKELILDGSPRTMRQAEWLVDKVRRGSLKISAVVHLTAPEAVVRRRLLARGRPDDHEEAISRRIHEYTHSVIPIFNYLKREGFKVHEISSEKSIEEVDKEIAEALGI